jgi:orotate phosphoribosyltransferase
MSRIEGNPRAPVIMIDDVTTTGGSIAEAVDVMEAIGLKVIKVITVLDREQGAKERFRIKGVSFVPILNHSDIVAHNLA